MESKATAPNLKDLVQKHWACRKSGTLCGFRCPFFEVVVSSTSHARHVLSNKAACASMPQCKNACCLFSYPS
jgi:hypothetical protein